MTDTQIAWFEIPVQELERAGAFYRTVLEANLMEMESPGGKMLAFLSGEAPIGALVEAQTSSADGVQIYFSTSDIEAALARVGANGGKVTMDKTSIGDYGNIGKFVDSEGNHISLHST